MTTSTGTALTFTGDNVDEVTDLGVHVIPHPTQDALIVFAHDGDLDPVGVLAAGQVLIVDDNGIRVAGMPDVEPYPLPVDDMFDPANATIDEVLTYLNELGDDQAEVDRVLALERAGKNRKTLVGDGE